MKKMSDKNFYLLFISLFIVLNLLNGYVVSLPFFNPGLNLYKITLHSFFTSFVGDLGFLLIILGLILLFAKNKRSVIFSLTLASVALSTIVFLLKIYSFYYGTAFSFFNLRTFSNSNPDLGRQLTIFLWKNLLSMGQYVAVIPAIILIVLCITCYKHERFPTNYIAKKFFKKDYLKFIKVLIIGLGFYSLSVFSFEHNIKAAKEFNVVEDLEAIQNMGVYTYLSVDLVIYLTDVPEEIEEIDYEKLEYAKLYLDENKLTNPLNFYGEKTNNTDAIFKDKTLIIIQLESFNNYLINLVVEDPETGKTYEITPFINSLANDSKNLYYSNFYSNIGVGKTSDAEFAALTGIVADGNIVTYYDYIHSDYETLPKLFTNSGYETYALRGSNMSFYRRETVYADFGFNPKNLVSEESLIAEGRLNPDEQYLINGWVDDYVIFDKIIDLVNKDEKQFIFSLSTILHSPFMDYEGITGVNGWSELVPGQIGRYLDYARYTDIALQYLFNTLEEKNLLDDVVFLLYGDHKSDMSIKEHSKLFPNINLLDNQELSHNTPLIISAKNCDLSDYSESTSLVRSQRDIKRTVANLFGLNAKYNFGIDILTTDRTIAYVPLTMDVFTDDFHLNYRGEKINNEEFELDITEFKNAFDRYKNLNDLILHYNFFKEN